MVSLRIDHIGLLGPSVQALVQECQALGFSVIGPVELTAEDEDGNSVSLGQRSAHVMFSDDYIELTAVHDATADHHLAQFLKPPWGIRLLLLACDDIGEAHTIAGRRELDPGTVQTATRKVTYGNRAAARFRWFGLPPAAWSDVLVAFVQHQTHDLVFDASVSRHPNGALGIARLYYRASRLPAIYGKLGNDGTHRIDTVRPGRETDVLGFSANRCTPFAGVGVRVADLDGVRSLLRDAGIDARDVRHGISTQLRSGVCVVFEQCETCR